MSLLAAIDDAAPAMVEFTRELIAIPTENPPGAEYARCAGAIARRMHELGLEPEIVEGPAPCAIGSYGAGEPVLFFHGHYDVVPRSREGQFEPAIEGAKLYGRGSSDMKGGLASMIYAVAALRRTRARLAGRVMLVIVPDEETGGARGSEWLTRSGALPAGGVGMLTAEPTSGVVWNASRGAISLRVTVRGKAAHVGLSHRGVNAFERMMAVARELEKLKGEVALRQSAFRTESRGSILMMGGECRGGSSFNLVPDSCTFTVDRRINPEEDLETEKRRLLDLLAEHECEILQEGPASGTAEDHPFGAAVARAVESVTGRRPVFEMCPGLLDTRFYAQRGVPAFAYGPGLLEVSHGPNEYVPMENLRTAAAVYARVAEAVLVAGGGDEAAVDGERGGREH